MKTCDRGQGMIEAVLALPILIGSVMVITMILYRSIVFHFSDYQAHEALMCAQSEGTYFCKNELEKKIKKILISGSTVKVTLNKSLFGGFTAKIDINLHPNLLKKWQVSLKIEQTISRNYYDQKKKQ
jgi:hypothetical protein